jgi:hypothetical protein
LSVVHQPSRMTETINLPSNPMEKSLEEDSWIKGLRVTLLEKLEPLQAAENMTETVSEVKKMIEDNVRTYNEVRSAKLNGEEIDEDWATKCNWICIDHFCPNPYTHARGDPCKLTMEDMFPPEPEPPISEDARQSEDVSEDWLKEWDKKND